jgi:hypothetical protein
MVKGPKKLVLLGLMACVWVLSARGEVAAGPEELQTNKTLQPQALNHAGIYGLREIDPALTGSGVKFAVICRSITYIDGEPQNDYRPSAEHNCLTGKQLYFHDEGVPAADVSPHSTAICSILLGEDPNGFNPEVGQFHYQGAAPKARADIYEFWHFLIDNVFFGIPPDADIITASIGNEFEDWWTRGIESLAEQYGLIVVAGIGNGLKAQDTILYPGAGANAIGVGVVNSVNSDDLATTLAHFALAYPEHSSFGPTDNGRCKPDIVAPGNCLAADGNEPNRYEPTDNWSSFSTPIAAGTIGLLVQKAKQDANLSSALSPDGGNCVIKAIIMNSATKLPYWHKGRLEKDDDHSAPLDYIQGAGMLNAPEAYRHLIAGLNRPGNVPTTGWDLSHLDEGQGPENTYKIAIAKPANKLVTATVVWNKHYNSVYPFEPTPERDANLRLELWAVDPNDPDKDYLLDYSDSNIDNVEHIYRLADVNYTNYEIVVSSNNIDDQKPTGLRQQYALAWNVGSAPDSNNILWYDLNADGIVNESDFVTLLNNWTTSLKTPGSYFIGDMDNSGVFDANDLQILFDHGNLEADWHKK